MTDDSIFPLYTRFIQTAVEGKYADLDENGISDIVRVSSLECKRATSPDELRAMVRPLHSTIDDVHNQVVILSFFDRFASDRDFASAPLSNIHALVYGKRSDDMKRLSTSVDDYSGPLPTGPLEVGARFDELERFVVSVAGVRVKQEALQSRLLAHLFASIIRIHHFADGNGRTARFAVQYLLKQWGRAFLILPKVRNDADWKAALAAAIDGDLESFDRQFFFRLQRED